MQTLLTSKEIYKKINMNKKLLEEFNVSSLSLFGSYAKNQQTEKSDIDFLIFFKSKPETSMFDIVRLENKMKKIFNKKIHISFPNKKYINKNKAFFKENLINIYGKI